MSLALSGQVLGSLSSTLNARAQAQYFVDFGAESHSPAALAIGSSESTTLPVNDSFTLTEQLVAPSGTLPTGETYTLLVQAVFNNNRASTIGSTPGEYTAQATVDLGIQILSLEVPAIASCDSDSGVFFTKPPAVVPALSDTGYAVLFMALLRLTIWGLGQSKTTHQDVRGGV